MTLCMYRACMLDVCLSSVSVSRSCSRVQIRLIHKGRNFIPLQFSTGGKTHVKHVASLFPHQDTLQPLSASMALPMSYVAITVSILLTAVKARVLFHLCCFVFRLFSGSF